VAYLFAALLIIAFYSLTDQLPEVDVDVVKINHEDEAATLADVCGRLRQRPFSALLDVTWGGWEDARNMTG
jgi:hypothetical protein